MDQTTRTIYVVEQFHRGEWVSLRIKSYSRRVIEDEVARLRQAAMEEMFRVGVDGGEPPDGVAP